MENKNIIIIIMGVFLVALITAQIQEQRTTDAELTRAETNKLAEYDITNPEVTAIKCDSEDCYFRMFDGDYNLGEHIIPRKDNNSVDYTRAEIEVNQQRYIQSWLKNYTQILIDRENYNQDLEISPGTDVVIREASR